MSVSLNEAQRVIDAAVGKATELGLRISVAVCDEGGRIVAVNRMDGAFMAAAYGSIGKAIAAAAFGRPSGELAALADGPLVRGISRAEGDHMAPSAGAFPIRRGGVIVGACGVGGASDEQDEECALAGVAAYNAYGAHAAYPVPS